MVSRVNCFEMWWPGTELNRRRQPFQGCALPPELPGHALSSGPKRRRAHARAEVALTRAVRTLRACGTGPIIATQRKSLNQVIGGGETVSAQTVSKVTRDL